MLLGTLLGIPPLLRAWAVGKTPLAARFKVWLTLSYGLGIFAVTPSILRLCGVPQAATGHWLMNIFLLHPLVNQYQIGVIKGGALVFSIAGLQYILLVLAIRAARGRL